MVIIDIKIELEFEINSIDKAEVLSKLAELVKVAEQNGLNLKELELEEDSKD